MIVDPEQPLQAAEAVLEAADERRATIRRRVIWSVAFALVLATLAVLWLGTPLREWADVHRLVDAAHRLADSNLAPLAVLAAFLVGGFVVAPVNVLITATVIVFGPLLGALYALLGSLLSAIALHEVGRLLPAARLRERLDKPLRMLTGRMPRHNVFAIMLIRIVPVAPYSVVNVISGAAHVERGPYLVGTALGMLPGIVANALLIDRLIAAIEHPGPWTWALLAGVAAAVVALVALMRRRLRRAAAHD